MKWIQQYDAPNTEDDELTCYLKESHRSVSLDLTKRDKKKLNSIKTSYGNKTRYMNGNNKANQHGSF